MIRQNRATNVRRSAFNIMLYSIAHVSLSLKRIKSRGLRYDHP
jgi:hypothetical protein